MVQARLPDINTEFITFRREAIACLKSRDYTGMFTALYALNALLPVDYQIKISTRDYEKITQEDIYVECSNCEEIDPTSETERKLMRPTRILYQDLVIREKLLESFLSSLKGMDSIKVWKCPKCKTEHELEKTKLIQKVRKKPYFLKVVPDPPQRSDGVMDRNAYHRKLSQWAGNFIGELAHQDSKFREDYVPKDHENEMEEVVEGLEDEYQ